MIIGITGNSGTGKTSICEEIKKNMKPKTVAIFNADKIAKELSVPKQDYFNEIINLFSKEILTEEGMIDRKKLAKIIFSDSLKREKLNKITYQYVGEETKRRILKSKSQINIIDAPLLIESKLNKICDIVISIIADEKTKIERICKRDGIDKKTALQRLNSQKQDEFYIKNSDYAIVNNNNINLKKQMQDIIQYINSACYNKLNKGEQNV